LWDDFFGYSTSDYGFCGYGASGEGGSRPPGAPRSEDEDDDED